jgi:hypothetical protein
MSYDPILKEAAAKIELLCRQYDIGAHIMLVSRTHAEYRFCLPEWSALREEFDPTGAVIMRLKTNKAEMGVIQSKEKAELTAHFLCEIRDQAARVFQFVEHLLGLTKGKWDIKHSVQKIRPHRPEEN